MAIDIDLDKYDDDALERKMAAGGLIPHIKVRAFLHDAIDETSIGDTPATKLVFEISEGQYAGRKVKRDLRKEGKDEEATAKLEECRVRFMKRLGVLERYDRGDGKFGVREVEGVAGFEDVKGTECVIEVVEQRRFNNVTNQWEPSGFNEVAYQGIWTPDEFAALAKQTDEKKATGRGKGSRTPPAPAGSSERVPANQTPVGAVNTDGL